MHDDDLASPFGFAFGPTAITASRFNSSGSIELTKFPASSEYTAYYQDAVRNLNASGHRTGQSQAAVETIFRQAFTTVAENLRELLGHEPHFTSSFYSSGFGQNVQSVVREAMFDNLQHTIKDGPSHQATCNGYRFLEGKNLGRAPEDCNDEASENFILVLEYEREYLYLLFKELSFEVGTHYTHHKKLCIECGEDSRKAIGDEAYSSRLSRVLEDFINDQALPKHKREDIRAIIISGEASPASNAMLGAIALQKVGTEEVKLMTEIDPSEVVAHGSAVWAKLVKDHPEYFVIHEWNRVADEEYHIEHERMRRLYGPHDEL